MDADLKVIKVFIQEGKQIGYEVMRVDGSIIKVGRDQMVQAVSLGHKYANATISKSGVVRVSSDVPREDISATAKKPTGVLDYKGDITGFLKDGKTISPLNSGDIGLEWTVYNNPDYSNVDLNSLVFKTKYIPSGIVDKSINRNLYRTYLDPKKAYKKYTFHVSVAEAKKYGHPARVPRIEKFREEHDTNKTYSLWATDYEYTTLYDEDVYCGYDTITVWVYVLNIFPDLGVADSMVYLAMFNDILDVMKSRLDDGRILYQDSAPGRNAISHTVPPYYIKGDTMYFEDERIYKKYIATMARYRKVVGIQG